MINDGRVKVDSDVETLIRSNFALSGPKDMITDIAANYSLVGSESLGDYYTVYLTGTIPTDLPQEVTAKPVTLKKVGSINEIINGIFLSFKIPNEIN
ncbi:hypothetical protein [Vagococcus fluvialis]|uniref:hypothetical protein n=1 Tax=Vagococcus fluvialis TaxID=2738 RepID=UPI001F0E181B|nr:hypothetical protein [Vagococcus fluvialis]